MPLFNFQCDKCELIVEKFQKGTDAPDIICPDCDSEEFTKLLSTFNSRKWLDAKEMLSEKILPDAQKIMKKMKKGDNNRFLDIYGEK